MISKGDIVTTIPILNGEEDSIAVYAKDDVSVTLKKNHGSIVQKIELNRPRFAPVYKGDNLGKLIFTCDGAEIATVPLYALDYVAIKK